MAVQTVSFEQQPMSIEEFLSEYDAYIQQRARWQFPRGLVPVEVLDLEMDELVQLARIKLWKILQKRKIVHARLYIRLVVHCLIINMLRRPKRTVLLSFDDDEENIVQSNFVEASWLVPDLADEYEEYDLIVGVLEQTVELAMTFPPRQKLALLCLLKEHFAGESYLVQILEKQGLNAEKIFWPEDKVEKQRLKASLPAARERLTLIHENILS
jgi:DNA-directed RNA polymerase specialized sigma24 family protein